MTIRAFVNKGDGERGCVAGRQGLAQVFLGGVHAAKSVFIRVETEFPDQQCAPGIKLHAVRAGAALNVLFPLSRLEFHCSFGPLFAFCCLITRFNRISGSTQAVPNTCLCTIASRVVPMIARPAVHGAALPGDRYNPLNLVQATRQ
jgi:hypothetical protein